MKRRQFLGSTAAAAALAAIPGALSARPEPFDDQPLRTGHIGTGWQGQKLLRLATGLPGYDIRKVCDILPFRLNEARALAGPKTKAVNDYRYLLDDPDIDAVFIATPFFFHAKPLMDALDAGKHVYCEKTLVKGFDQIDAVSARVADTDRIVQTGYQHRYSDHLRHVASLIHSGTIGEIGKIECHWNRDGDWRRPVPSPEYERMINWRMYREYSGGLVAELSSHQMDICHWLLGSRPRQIMGSGGRKHWNDGRDIYDSTHVLVRYDNDAVVSYSCTTTNAHMGFRMTVFGTKGTLVTSLDEAWLSTDEWQAAEDGENEDVDAVTGPTMAPGGTSGEVIRLPEFNATRNAIAAFRESVLGETQPPASVANGLATARTVQLSLDAMDRGSVESY